jgi:hypothetical protein
MDNHKEEGPIVLNAPEIAKIVKGANCTIMILKRFIIAMTIIFISGIFTALYMLKCDDISLSRDLVLAWLALAAGVSAYYFKALNDESKSVEKV